MPHINTNNTQAGEECSLDFVFKKIVIFLEWFQVISIGSYQRGGGGMVGFIYRIRSNLNIGAAKSQKRARVKNQHESTPIHHSPTS
jgi:hypothetical protein